MRMRRLHLPLFLLSWTAATLLLAGGIFGWLRLTAPTLDIQMHNTFFVLTPSQALLFIGLVLASPLGGLYLLFTRRMARPVAGLVALAAVALIYLLGDAITVVAPAAVGSFWAINGIPAGAVGDGLTLRLLTLLKALQVGLSGVMLLAGYALGRRSQPTKTPGSQDRKPGGIT
jgi:hypothetical protein